MTEWFTVTEASEKIHIPVETIRRYIRSHSVHLRIRKTGKKYFIHDDSLEVMEMIRELYSEGKNSDEVEEALSSSGVPLTITIKDDDGPMTVHVADELKKISHENQQLIDKINKLEQFNQKLIDQLNQQHLYYEQKFEELKHDREFVHSLKESMQQRRIESAENANKTDEKLQSIEKKLDDLQGNDQVKELSEQVFALSQQFEQAMKETAASQEKKGFWAKVFGK